MRLSVCLSFFASVGILFGVVDPSFSLTDFVSQGFGGDGPVDGPDNGGGDSGTPIAELQDDASYGTFIFLLASVINGALSKENFGIVLGPISNCVDNMDYGDLEKLQNPAIMAEFVELQTGLHQQYAAFDEKSPDAPNFTELFRYLVPETFWGLLREAEGVPFPYFDADYEEEQRELASRIIARACEGDTPPMSSIDGDKIKGIFKLLVSTKYTLSWLEGGFGGAIGDKMYWQNIAENIIKDLETDQLCMPVDHQDTVENLQAGIGNLFDDDVFICFSTSSTYNPKDAHAGKWKDEPREKKEQNMKNAASNFKP